VTGRRRVGEHVGAAFSIAHSNCLCPASGDPVEQRDRASCRENALNVGDREPGAGRLGSLPRAGAVKDRVDSAVGRLVSLSRIENRMQLVGRPDQLGCLPTLTSEVAGRGGELWIWVILLASGCPRGIGELVDELHHPGELDLRNREHTRQCNVVKALIPLQLPLVDSVELRGFEPLTPSMPWRCATSCATAP
jgi:hypothetical protein